jgi:hypothetical protein
VAINIDIGGTFADLVALPLGEARHPGADPAQRPGASIRPLAAAGSAWGVDGLIHGTRSSPTPSSRIGSSRWPWWRHGFEDVLDIGR